MLEPGPVIDHFPIQVLPVIEPGASQVAVVEAESQRAHQPQFGAQGHAGSADVAGVVGDFRLVKHNVEHDFKPRTVKGM